MLAVSVDRMQQEGIKGQWDTINQPDRKWTQYLTITKFVVANNSPKLCERPKKCIAEILSGDTKRVDGCFGKGK